MQRQRRDFFKITTAGATGLVLARANRAFAAWPATGTMPVNPTISNTLVVGCYDAAMMKSKPTSTKFDAENAAVDSARVAANMDAMAMQLANATSADTAWKAIFRSGKAWASTVVAIKVNTIEPMNMARIAVVQKFCSVLANLGVAPANTIIYDGNTTYGAGISNYTSYFSLTDASKIPAVVSHFSDSLGGTTSAPLPDGSSATCTADIAKGTVDILINIANNKGHSMFGGSTLCMKNHFGTFAPNHTNLASYVFNINKSDAILGGTPVRQQLCFIDSLIANKAANTGQPEVMPCYLIMGTFAPIVDYLTVKKVREAVMSCTHDAATVKSFLTSFGYIEADPLWVLVPPAGSGSGSDGGTDAPIDARSDETGGSGSGGTTGAGGAGGSAKGGSGGTSSVGSGGASSRPGGSSGSGGVVGGTGGAGKGGSAGSGNGGSGLAGTTDVSAASGGRGGTASSTTTTASGSGGSTSAAGQGGTTGAAPAPSVASGCEVGRVGPNAGRWGAMLVVGAAVAGEIRRFLARKQTLANAVARSERASSGIADSDRRETAKSVDRDTEK